MTEQKLEIWVTKRNIEKDKINVIKSSALGLSRKSLDSCCKEAKVNTYTSTPKIGNAQPHGWQGTPLTSPETVKMAPDNPPANEFTLWVRILDGPYKKIMIMN